MKKQGILLLGLIFLAGSLLSLNAQSNKVFQSVFTDMNKKQIQLAKQQKFTKVEVVALNKAMTSAGKRLIRIIEASPGETNQYLINNINSEFKKLNTEYGKILSGTKLRAWNDLSNVAKTSLVKKLQTQYLGGAKGARAGIRTNLRAGIRASLINGFGGEETGDEILSTTKNLLLK